jgi:8-oxo-dGTP pyrophosphatase MutT (NUDIX family)
MISLTNLFESKLPLRYRVEIIIIKDNQILLTIVPPYPPTVTKSYFNFPGGGIEQGNTPEETVRKECLEEVGIKVKNIQKIDMEPFIQTHQQAFQKKTTSDRINQRGQQYSGYHTTFYVANYDKIDKRLYGSDDDEMIYKFVPFKEAINIMVEQSKNFEDKSKLKLFERRLEALENLKKDIK